ncbi:MAG: RNA--NAD 2'-phosphotransferase, partial [Candidatus Lokiarchaeota archaeon]|nr:RNA--NAD 2'-phosphotransferase [Candidatus Lokiarchaeota archaeon]
PTAMNVGKRRGQPVVYRIFAQKMAENGYKFFLSDNGVWLVDIVPREYMDKLKPKRA